MTAGGKRKGAGRPPLPADDRPQAVTVRIHPQLVRRFADWRAARGLSQAEAFANWLRRLKP